MAVEKFQPTAELPVSPLFDEFPQLLDDAALEAFFVLGHELGFRMELVDSGFSWEAGPGRLHQEHVLAIVNSVKTGAGRGDPCSCYKLFDSFIRLPDGLVKSPDVSIFCNIPPEEEGFIHMVPRAVIEITSPNYEDKDLLQGPTIYLRNGVEDVIVLHRRTGQVHHWTARGRQVHTSPHEFELSCGCVVTV